MIFIHLLKSSDIHHFHYLATFSEVRGRVNHINWICCFYHFFIEKIIFPGENLHSPFHHLYEMNSNHLFWGDNN